MAALLSQKAAADVSAALTLTTVRAATLLLNGKALAVGLVSSKVVALAQGGTEGMGLTKLKIATILLLIAGAGGAVAALRLSAEPPAPHAHEQQPGSSLQGASVKDAREGDTAGKKVTTVRHEGRIYCTALSPDGHTFASGGYDGAIFLWNAASGKELRRLAGHRGEVSAIAFSPDSKLLASSGYDDTVRVWELATGKQLHRCEGQRPLGPSLAFSPDGKVIASGGYVGDGTICLWDAKSGKELRRWIAHQLEVSALAFSPDGTVLASAGGDKAVQLWESATGKAIRACVAPREKLFLITSLAFSPDGRTLAGGSWLKAAHLWEVATGTQRGQLSDHNWVVGPVAFAWCGRFMITASDGILRAWDLATGREIERVRVPGTAKSLSFVLTADGRTKVCGHTGDAAVIWEVPGVSNAARQPQEHLGPEDLGKLWDDLGDSDGARAYRAVQRFAGAKKLVALMKEQLHPVRRADATTVKMLLEKLESDKFTEREIATRDLEKLGATAESMLRVALDRNSPLESRRRLEALLERLEGERLRSQCALDLLEGVASQEAEEFLRQLAGGDPGAWLTQQAKSSLQRVERKARNHP